MNAANVDVENRIVIRVETNPNLVRRSCVLTILLLSSFMLLRVQEDHHSALGWHGGAPDTAGPFPWEKGGVMLSRNSTYLTTFLSPAMRRASTFEQPLAFSDGLVVTDTQSDSPGAVKHAAASQYGASGYDQVSEIAAVLRYTSPLPACTLASGPPSSLRGNEGTAGTPAGTTSPKAARDSHCYVALQQLASEELGSKASNTSSCFRFVAGESLTSLKPPRSASDVGCMRTRRIRAAVNSASSSHAVLAWDPNPNHPQTVALDKLFRHRSATCLALVEYPTMRSISVAVSDMSVVVLFDRKSASVVTVGYTGGNSLMLQQYDARSLKLKYRYRLQLSVGWLFQSPENSDGYIIFIGAEEPFVGMTFIVDLVASELYEQDPPSSSGRRYPRRHLPRSNFVDAPGEPNSRETLTVVEPPQGLCDITLLE